MFSQTSDSRSVWAQLSITSSPLTSTRAFSPSNDNNYADDDESTVDLEEAKPRITEIEFRYRPDLERAIKLLHQLQSSDKYDECIQLSCLIQLVQLILSGEHGDGNTLLLALQGMENAIEAISITTKDVTSPSQCKSSPSHNLQGERKTVMHPMSSAVTELIEALENLRWEDIMMQEGPPPPLPSLETDSKNEAIKQMSGALKANEQTFDKLLESLETLDSFTKYNVALYSAHAMVLRIRLQIQACKKLLMVCSLVVKDLVNEEYNSLQARRREVQDNSGRLAKKQDDLGQQIQSVIKAGNAEGVETRLGSYRPGMGPLMKRIISIVNCLVQLSVNKQASGRTQKRARDEGESGGAADKRLRLVQDIIEKGCI